MRPYDVYPLYPIALTKAEGVYVWDKNGNKYLDLYGGHAVISIGHSHPRYLQSITEQLGKIAFYSNSVVNPLQEKLAENLGLQSGYEKYQLFLCNSGAEANENALKLASFHTGKRRVIAFTKSFHGRTSAAVAVTDNPKIVSSLNSGHEVCFIALNDRIQLEKELKKGEVCAVIVEGIQGMGGIHIPAPDFLVAAADLCKKHGAVFILDEIQSGYGRTGKFFAHQYAGIQPDIITLAKGMGNGFPIGGVMIHPKFEPIQGSLGTTFGGNHLACAAGIAVLEVLEEEKLMDNAILVGDYLIRKLRNIPATSEVRGLGLMIGVEFDFPIKELRENLLFEHKIFTGYSGTATLRLLPPLSLQEEDAEYFINALTDTLAYLKQTTNSSLE